MPVPVARASYILPIRAARASEELAAYLRRLPVAQVIVVDGSAPDVFAAFKAMLGDAIEHVAPSPAIYGLNGKARGVICGLAYAAFDRVVLADDDVRYDDAALEAVLRALDTSAVVRPQNFFAPLPWHAVIDTARSLINRALDGDWPGTLALRRSFLPRAYNPDVLFENFEMVRTIRERGGIECVRRDIYVRRLPPTSSHYAGQRIRQAYDEFARPLRLCAFLAIAPLGITAALRFGLAAVGSAAALSILLATAGLLRENGYRYFPWVAALAAPLWVVERAVCAWLAVYARLRHGGIRYAGAVIRAAASSPRERRLRWSF